MSRRPKNGHIVPKNGLFGFENSHGSFRKCVEKFYLVLLTIAREAPQPLCVCVSAIPFRFEPAMVGGNLQGPNNTVWVVCTEPGTVECAIGGTAIGGTAIIHIIPIPHSSSSW